MVEAAGLEFRRAHEFWSKEFRSPQSHGDAGMAKVIYDENEQQHPDWLRYAWLGIAKYKASKNDFAAATSLTQRYGRTGRASASRH